MKQSLWVSTFTFIMLLSITDAFGKSECTCLSQQQYSSSESISYNDAIFTGRILYTKKITDTDFVAKFAIYKSWKGVKEKYTSIISTTSKKDCGINFKIGEEYIVYAYIPSFTKKIEKQKQTIVALTTSSCTPTKKLSNLSQEEIKSLGHAIYDTKIKSQLKKGQ